uniref:Uncharacterized protein n=1 Tax=Acrobeloides nanus TaxID=290746 RepID=A0A914EJG8_9BILA
MGTCSYSYSDANDCYWHLEFQYVVEGADIDVTVFTEFNQMYVGNGSVKVTSPVGLNQDPTLESELFEFTRETAK